MRQSHSNHSPSFRLRLAIVIFYFCNLVDSVLSLDSVESRILSQFKPISMDESITVERNPKSRAGYGGPKGLNDINAPSSNFLGPRSDTLKPLGDLSELGPSSPYDGPSDMELDSGLSDIRDNKNLKISDTLFALPKNESSPILGKLITGKEKPTFGIENVFKPTLSKDKSGKIIATYKLMIPILIPAVRVKQVPSSTAKPVKYLKEVHTKMVPMKKIIPRAKTILKAERIPHKIITDYVKIDGHTIPSEVNDKLRPDDEVIGSVVEDYD